MFDFSSLNQIQKMAHVLIICLFIYEPHLQDISWVSHINKGTEICQHFSFEALRYTFLFFHIHSKRIFIAFPANHSRRCRLKKICSISLLKLYSPSLTQDIINDTAQIIISNLMHCASSSQNEIIPMI